MLRIEYGRIFRHRRYHQIGGDDGQIVQAHCFHGTRGGADIGGMAGAREDDADVVQISGQGGFFGSHVLFSVFTGIRYNAPSFCFQTAFYHAV